ncbi:MAG: hypothetical protein KDE68_08880 [Rhodocyclaceae bacterium]|nr:hypothetical protein [Rhodocyclaceae bacterium]
MESKNPSVEIEVLRAEARILQSEPLAFDDFKRAVVDGMTGRIENAKAEIRNRLLRRVTHYNLPEQFPTRQLNAAADVVDQVEAYLSSGLTSPALALLPSKTICAELDAILAPLADSWPAAGDINMPYDQRKARLAEITNRIEAIRTSTAMQENKQ